MSARLAVTATAPTATDLADFVYREARLLDERRFQDWYDLFAEDGRYWLPMRPGQTDPVGEQSITVEDKMLLQARIVRLTSGKAYSDKPPVLCQHVLQAPACEEFDHAANRYRTRTAFLYVEFRGEDQRLFAGTVQHLLRLDGGALRIVEKRVDLLNASAPLATIFLMP
jgi:3-phenylpropionate/cinnamic acid dioxygenase small subunit